MELSLELAFLGSGNAFAPGRYWNGFLANRRILFDAPPTTLPHLRKLGVPSDDIQVVFITHFHADHFFGLPFLLLEYGLITHRTAPLWIVGPPEIETRLRTITDVGFPNLLRGSPSYEIRFIEVTDGFQGEAADARFQAIRVDHVNELASFAYRVDVDGHTLAYSGDARMSERLATLGADADVFVVECSCWDGPCGPHLSPDDVRELRRRIAPATSLLATHLDGGSGDLGDGVLVADDFSTFRF